MAKPLGVKQKAIICCPFHADSNTSAFVDYSTKSSNYYISCSACGITYWAEKIIPPVEQVCERFYSYSTDITDVGLTGIEFHILAGAETDGRKYEYFHGHVCQFPCVW